MATYGQKLAQELKEKFNISNRSCNELKKQVDAAVQRVLVNDAKYHKVQPENKKVHDIYTKEEVIVLTVLRAEIAEIRKSDFPGRTYTNDVLIKFKRLQELEDKFNQREKLISMLVKK